MLQSAMHSAAARVYPLRAAERSTVWLLGSPRSGSTWLLNLLANHPRVVPIDELGIGWHLGVFTSDVVGMPSIGSHEETRLASDSMRERPDYFFSERYAHAWRPALRRFLLTRVRAQVVEAPVQTPLRERLAVVKEPNGSQAAELMLDALPQSKALVLIRDGRDVIDSLVDALKKDSWLSTSVVGGATVSSSERFVFLRSQAYRWVARTRAVMRAYEHHDPARRYLLRYEDLRSNTAPLLRPLFAWLGLTIGDDALEELVQRMAFENVPADARGSGRFQRAATPGLWRDNLSPAEQDEALRIMGPTLQAAGYSE